MDDKPHLLKARPDRPRTPSQIDHGTLHPARGSGKILIEPFTPPKRVPYALCNPVPPCRVQGLIRGHPLAFQFPFMSALHCDTTPSAIRASISKTLSQYPTRIVSRA